MIRRLKLFGYSIWISNDPLRVVHKDRKRNSYRSSQRNLRLEMTGGRCEVCGKPIDKSCHIHRMLPANAPDRNSVENIRVVCEEDLKANGFDVIVFVPSYDEDNGLITCGNAILSGKLPTSEYEIIENNE